MKGFFSSDLVTINENLIIGEQETYCKRWTVGHNISTKAVNSRKVVTS